MAVSNSSRVQFGTPTHGKGASSRPERGRRCAEPTCATVLSTYNRSETCFIHTIPAYKHPLHRD